MRNKFCVLIILLLNANISANENIRNYMLSHNMNYPYHVGFTLQESYFIDYEAETNKNRDDVDTLELTDEQKKILIPFFDMLDSISSPEYFTELKKLPHVIAFSIDWVYLAKYSPDQIYIHAGVMFYSDNIPAGFEENFWRHHNIAIYSIHDYRFLGFHFN
jgi:hypothetical protein